MNIDVAPTTRIENPQSRTGVGQGQEPQPNMLTIITETTESELADEVVVDISEVESDRRNSIKINALFRRTLAMRKALAKQKT